MSFKNKFKMTSIALASAVAMGSMALPTVASADVSSSASIASMYLWRGQNISGGKPALSGDITYTHSSGAYAFGWLSSEGSNSYETDLGLGYAGKAGSMGYDVSYYAFWYPTSSHEKLTDAGAEVVVALTFDPVTFKAYIDAKKEYTYNYFTLSGSVGKFDMLVGMDSEKTSSDGYTHFDLSYNATDRLAFTYSQVISKGSTSTVSKDPLMMMSYSIPVDLK